MALSGSCRLEVSAALWQCMHRGGGAQVRLQRSSEQDVRTCALSRCGREA